MTSTMPDAGGRSMRFAVEGWDPRYGSGFEIEDELDVSEVTVVPGLELPVESWRALPAAPVPPPPAILFVDGVRRLEARIWIEHADALDAGGDGHALTEATAAMCASYAAGTVCCCSLGAHLLEAEPRRGLFTTAGHARTVRTPMGDYPLHVARLDPTRSLAASLSAAVQREMAQLEVATALQARTSLAGHGVTGDDDLLVVDGPIRGREHLPRALGYVKSHQSAYLDPDQHRLVATLGTAERTPVFRIGGAWDRYSWYLRLPCLPAGPWAGVVRLECNPDLPLPEVIALADLSQAVLPRFGSAEYKDARAPQNLYPIAGLERELRRRLGDPRVLYRALRTAAALS